MPSASAELSRRALLGAALAAPAAAQTVDLRERLRALRVGANLERWYPIARDNHPRRLGREWWRDFRAAGFDHVRMFLPEVGQTGGGDDIPELFRQAAEDAMAAGLPVLLGLADTYYQSSPWGERDWRALNTRAAYLAPRLDPGMVVLAALNEPAFDDTRAWVPVRDRLLAAVRQAAPRHLLMWGGREWCSWRSLLEITPPADPATVAEVHDYQGGDAAAVRGRFADIARWRDRHRLPVLVTEINGSEPTRQDRGRWAAEMRAAVPVLRELRLPTTLWSYSFGSWYRMQPGDEAAPHPEVRALLRA